jgi:hypothetical protein
MRALPAGTNGSGRTPMEPEFPVADSDGTKIDSNRSGEKRLKIQLFCYADSLQSRNDNSPSLASVSCAGAVGRILANFRNCRVQFLLL